MSNLSVTRALTSNTNPTEAQFDTMRTDLLNFFNVGTNLDAANFATGGLTWDKLGGPVPDNPVQLAWTNAHVNVSYGTGKFKIQNTEGDLIWAHRTGSTITEFLQLRKDDGAIEVWGVPQFNTSTGSQAVDLMWLLSRYRKPRLVYVDSNIFTVEDNGPTAGEVLVMGRDRLWKICDTTCSLAVDANGETTGDTGAAVSGRYTGEARTANRWYFVYAVEVQFGDDADGINAILVAGTTAPIAANIATLNTAFGTGKWVYMGCLRNGYNDGVNTDIIVPFVYDENGYCRFTLGPVNNECGGLTLATQTNDVVNLEYDLVIGNAAAATVPAVATRAVFGGYREAYGFELHYRQISSLENHFITTGCYHIEGLSTLTPIIQMEVPVLSGYRVVVVMGNVATNKRISLLGFFDHYV